MPQKSCGSPPQTETDPLYPILSQLLDNQIAIKDTLISQQVFSISGNKKIGQFDYSGWTGKRSQDYHVQYEITATYTGSNTTIDLDFPENVELQYYGLIWNNATAKDLEIRVYADYRINDYYNLLYKNTNYTIDKRMEREINTFMPAGTRLRFYFENYTVGNIVTAVVGVREV